MKSRALRRRVWFRELTKMERSVMELTIRYVQRIRSERLALVIGRISCKILKAFRSKFLERVKTVGINLVERISEIAVSWGYAEALCWKHDPGFIRFLGITTINNSSGWYRG